MTEQMPQKVKREKGPTNSPRNSSPKKYCRKNPKYFVKYRILAKKVSFFSFVFLPRFSQNCCKILAGIVAGLNAKKNVLFAFFFSLLVFTYNIL